MSLIIRPGLVQDTCHNIMSVRLHKFEAYIDNIKVTCCFVVVICMPFDSSIMSAFCGYVSNSSSASTPSSAA